MGRVQPSPPMRRGGVADIGHARIAFRFQELRRGRHPPSGLHQFQAAVLGVADDRRLLIGIDAAGFEVAGPVAPAVVLE